MTEKQAPPLRRTLENILCTRGQDIFLVLQYLLPPRPWKWNPIFSLSSVPINLQQWIMRIHIHICLHFMNWLEQWASIQMILKMSMCLFSFSLSGKAKKWLKSHPNQNLTSWKDVEENFLQDFSQSLATSKQSLKSLCSDKEQMKLYVRHGKN